MPHLKFMEFVCDAQSDDEANGDWDAYLEEDVFEPELRRQAIDALGTIEFLDG